MDDTVDFVVGENAAQQVFIPHISLIEGNLFSCDLLHPAQAFGVGIAQVVDDNGLMARFDQLHTGVAADVSGTAGDKNLHLAISFTI